MLSPYLVTAGWMDGQTGRRTDGQGNVNSCVSICIWNILKGYDSFLAFIYFHQQSEEENKFDLYMFFFHIVQRIPEYLLHLQVSPNDENCLSSKERGTSWTVR